MDGHLYLEKQVIKANRRHITYHWFITLNCANLQRNSKP